MNSLEDRLQVIEERNAKVEAEKAWETSWMRRVSIAILTYCIACAFLWSIGVMPPWIHALVPTGGYLLSTLSMKWVRQYWMHT